MATGPGARVVLGFEDAMRVGLEMLRAARQVGIVMPGYNFEEFALPVLPEAREVLARGGSVRVVVVGTADPAVVREARDAGLDIRVLDESREVALMATDVGAVLFSPEMRPESPLTPCVVAVLDIVAVTHFRLAFERAWAAAMPVEPPRSPGSVQGKRARGR